MSYAAVTKKNAPPLSEQPHPDLALLNTEKSPVDTFADENSKVNIVEVDPRIITVDNDSVQQDRVQAPPDSVPRSSLPNSANRSSVQHHDGGGKRKAVAKIREGEKSTVNFFQRYFIRPHVAGGLLGVVNTGLLSGLGYAFYLQPHLLREPKFILLSTTLAAATVYVEEAADITTRGFETMHRDDSSSARTLSAALGIVNAMAMGGLGYLGFMNWNRPHWDRKAIPLIVVGVVTVLGGESVLFDSLQRLTFLLLCGHYLASIFFALGKETDADDGCVFTQQSLRFDLSKLSGEHSCKRTRDTPPTKMIDAVRLNLCGDLAHNKDEPVKSQCPEGTRVCLSKINKNEDSERVISVIPIATTAGLKPEVRQLSSPTKGLELVLWGPSYPNPIDSLSAPQSLNISLLCADSDTEIKFVSYDFFQLRLEWSTVAGCEASSGGTNPPTSEPGHEKEKDSESNKNVGSGISWFFFLILFSLATYFGLGAYYNYSTYGASGLDLIPHRDFWKEVPYMLQDVVAHLCKSARPRRMSSQGGYVAV